MLKLAVLFYFAVLLAAAVPSQTPAASQAIPNQIQIQPAPRHAPQGNGSHVNSTNNPSFILPIAHPNNRTSPSSDALEDKQQTTPKSDHDLFDYAGLTLSIFVGIGTLIILTVQLFFLRGTDRATTKAANAAQASADALLSQLRPVISVEGKALVKARRGEPLAVFFEVKNSGQTPAFGVQVLAGVQFLPNPLPEPLPPAINAAPRDTATFDIPRDKAHASRRTMLRAPTAEEWLRLEANTDALYLHGKILYRDDFGNDGEVEFCQFLDNAEINSWIATLAEDGKLISLNFRIAPFNNETRVTRRKNT